MASNDPFKNMTDFQRMWLESWANGTRQMVEIWRHMFDVQQNFLKKAAEQHHRWHTEISDGASFTDKYGKRAHDIDPERDV